MPKMDFAGFMKDLKDEIGKAESAVQARLKRTKMLESSDPLSSEAAEGPLGEAEAHLARCREIIKHSGSVSEVVEFLVLASREIGRAEGRLYAATEKPEHPWPESEDEE